MKRFISSEKLLIEEVALAARAAKGIARGLSIGSLIKMIRSSLGMSQKILAERARVPQSTVSRIERGTGEANLSTLNKILSALFCDLVVLPFMHESIEEIRHKQARKQAEKRIRYLKGTMSLEDQQPDSRMVEELLKREQDRLLQGPGSKLWEK